MFPSKFALRSGKTDPSSETNPELRLARLCFAPVLKTQWNITGDEKHVLVPSGGTFTPPIPACTFDRQGFDWVARRGIVALIQLIVICPVKRRNRILGDATEIRGHACYWAMPVCIGHRHCAFRHGNRRVWSHGSETGTLATASASSCQFCRPMVKGR